MSIDAKQLVGGLLGAVCIWFVIGVLDDIAANTQFRIGWNAKWPGYGKEIEELAREERAQPPSRD